MDILVNQTARAIVVDDRILVPRKACEVESAESLQKQFPRLAELLETGEVTLKTKKGKTKTPEKTESVEEQSDEPDKINLLNDTVEEEYRPAARRKKG